MYITCKQKRCNSVNVCTDTSSQLRVTCCLSVCRCLHFPHGRKSSTRSCLTSATYFWHPRRGSKCLNSTSRSGPKRRGGKNIGNSAKRRTHSVNFLRRPSSMESKYSCGLESGMGDYLVSTKSESLISCTFHCALSVFLPHLFFSSTES